MLSPDERSANLSAAVVELERHCAQAGWQTPRLFALVPTADLLDESPEAAAEFGITEPGPPGAWTAIEQGDIAHDGDVVAALQQIDWPEAVKGCAIAVERSFLPAQAEASLPDDPAEAQAFVEDHPERHDIRLVVAATRDKDHYAVGRLLSDPDELLGGPDFAPGLATLLETTLG